MKPRLFIKATRGGIEEIGLGPRRRNATARSLKKSNNALVQRWVRAARKELTAYFSGKLRSFSTPCDPGVLPPFTRKVLRITAGIPYGQVRSYRWVAERLGNPRATRAVGNALARNPIPIMIPCHRVVRNDGSLGGYALGLSWKKKLLEMERVQTGRKA